MTLTHINPDTLHHNPAFSQGVLVEGRGPLLFVGGQNGVDASGTVVSDDIREQTAQALRNLLAVLESVGASQEHVAKLTIYVVAGADIQAGFEASQEIWGYHPTAITVPIVAGLGVPGALVEIDAIAQVPSRT